MRTALLVLLAFLAAACGPTPTRPPVVPPAPSSSPVPPPTATATLPPTPLPSPTPQPSATRSPTSSPSPSATQPAATLAPTPTRPIAPGVPVYGYRVVAAYPHDPGAFTQGLVLDGASLYEGTGLLGQSTLRRADLQSGQVEQLTRLPDDLFGEGIAAVGDEIVQLTWKAGLGYVYDRDSFELRRTFGYDGEGWGLAYDGQRLVMSDGTATLRFLDPVRLEVTGRVDVADALGPVTGLNELEVVDGEVWANVWRTDWIVRIDPASGRVTGWIDLAGLLSPEEAQAADVLNGIAYDAAAGRLVVTGKRWPKVFEIELLRRR